MKSRLHYLPAGLTVAVSLLFLFYGPIPQLAHYHEFADHTAWLGIPHSLDVLTNIGFMILGIAGLKFLFKTPWQTSDYGYSLFIVSIIATGVGSSYYHWAPDDARLFWDRLPIALASAALLAAVRAESLPGMNHVRAKRELFLLVIVAVFSVVWWQRTGDLRPYLGLQIASLMLIPLWQAIYTGERRDRIAFAIAILLYVIAKVVELNDALILDQLHFISGHSLKHLFASAASGVIILRILSRVVSGSLLKADSTNHPKS